MLVYDLQIIFIYIRMYFFQICRSGPFFSFWSLSQSQERPGFAVPCKICKRRASETSLLIRVQRKASHGVHGVHGMHRTVMRVSSHIWMRALSGSTAQHFSRASLNFRLFHKRFDLSHAKNICESHWILQRLSGSTNEKRFLLLFAKSRESMYTELFWHMGVEQAHHSWGLFLGPSPMLDIAWPIGSLYSIPVFQLESLKLSPLRFWTDASPVWWAPGKGRSFWVVVSFVAPFQTHKFWPTELSWTRVILFSVDCVTVL